ncbi:ATP-dependent RecD-like DNA helicase [Bacillus phage vB_BsuM-Goe21]|nr:ATP-dependent RecD-like DNA helicase [Bacillus phage vB_BsuM-Goe21]
MADITLTDKQNKAKNECLDWYFGRETNGKDPDRIFTIAGLAGTGKSTLVKFIIEEIGLDVDEVVFIAYTGMAANVLTRKGNVGASTIHKFIYHAIPVKDPETGEVLKFIFKLKEKDEMDDKIKLVVIDEVSMVDTGMLNEVHSFGIRTMALGDPGQLPPVGNSGNTLLKNPDVFLDEIMRQALDNPIIYLSMLAREGKFISYGTHGDRVQVIRRHELYKDMFLGADQIIAGYNETVQNINAYHRRFILGIENPFPIVGDKIICGKNQWEHTIYEDNLEVSLVNGLIGRIESIENQKRSATYKISFRPEFFKEEKFPKLYMNKIPFMNEKVRESFDEKSLYVFRKKIIETYGISEFKFGYAISCHKSQGSEFDNVLLFEERLNKKFHKNWLYTGITRAKEKLILVR